MKILMVSATETEIAPLMQAFPQLDYCITGVGMVQAVLKVSQKLAVQKYDLAIQGGIAGAFAGAGLEPAELCIVQKDCIADMGVLEAGQLRSVFDMGFAAGDELPFHQGFLVNENAGEFGLKMVTGATVNMVSTDGMMIELIRDKYEADIETMEGAAFHMACIEAKQKFVQVRAVSNYLAERDKSKWCIAEAVEKLNGFLTRYIKQNS